MLNLQKILWFLNKVEKLKTIKRQVSISDNSRKESPAEHSWRVALMGMILHKELRLQLDLLKALEIILVHDIVEAVAWDVWILDKSDTGAHSAQKAKEFKAAEELYSMLPNEAGGNLNSLWLEYENQSSEEAKFAWALDKIEVIIQRVDLGVDQWERDDIYPILSHWADESVENFPALKDFWVLVQTELANQFPKRL